MTDNPVLDAASGYIRRGWAVIPVYGLGQDGACSCRHRGDCKTPAKHPIWNDWPARGITSSADAWAVWVEDYPGANVGIVTGSASGQFVLDVDPLKGGFDSLAGLLADHGPLPKTRIHSTGSGGLHYLFAMPPGLIIPTTANTLGAGLDTRADGNGMVVAPPSRSGLGGYGVLVDMDPQPAPDWLLERLVEIQARRESATHAEPVAGVFLDINSLPTKLRDRLAEADPADRSAHFHGAVAACRRAGLSQAQTVTALGLWCSVVGKYVGRVEAEVARSWGKLNDADPANDPDRYVAELLAEQTNAGPDPIADDETGPVLPLELRELVALARAYQDLPDPSHIFVTLAVAATRDLDDDPTWLLLVAPPSSGKTEAVRSLRVCADAHLDDVTAAGLLSWKTGKNPRPTGVLVRVGKCALVTFGDLSTLLAGSDAGVRDTTFAILRKVYDGHVVRDLGTAPEPLDWSGKVTVVAAVTGIIDRYAVHNDALGPRWVYYRLTARDTAGKRRAAERARHGGLDPLREALAAKMAQVVYAARSVIADVKVPEQVSEDILDAALVTCWGRASVPRHGYGRREIDGMAVTEEPPRVVRQLMGVARGLLALGLDEEHTTRLVRRVALDSMPASRCAVLTVLASADVPMSTSAVAAAGRLDRHVAGRNLEELEQVGVVAGARVGAEPEQHEVDRRVALWSLAGPDGALIRQVIVYALTCGDMWTDKRVPTPPPPQNKEREGGFTTQLSGHPPDPHATQRSGHPSEPPNPAFGPPSAGDAG